MPINRILTGTRPRKRILRKRPSAKLHNSTVRDFGGGLNVVDNEQNLTSKFSPVFDNMTTHTDRRVSPRFGYEMWLKTKQGTASAPAPATFDIITTPGSRWVNISWPGHPFNIAAPLGDIQHITISGVVVSIGGVPAADFNQTHGVKRIDANSFAICVRTTPTSHATTAVNVTYVRDTHMCGGFPVECTYFNNHVVVWTSCGEIFVVNVAKEATRIWSASIAAAQLLSPIPWGDTDLVAFDVFGKELLCSNGLDKSISIDFTRTFPNIVLYQVDPGNSSSDDKVPTFDACKAAFRYWNIHDSSGIGDHVVDMRVAAKDTSVVFSDAPSPDDAVDVNVAKIAASSELTIRAFATIKDTLLVIMPSVTVMMKLGVYDSASNHDPQPIDTLQGFGTSSMRSVIEIGSDVFMVDYNGVPSARLSSVSNAVVPERVSQYIETMIGRHIGRLKKETTRLKLFGFFDTKNKLIHFYLPKFDETDVRLLNADPFYYDKDMASTQSMIMRHDAHQVEVGDIIRIEGATGFGAILASSINGDRTVLGVLDENYILISIGQALPVGNDGGGGNAVYIQPLNNETIGYIYHFVPALKMQAWSRFKTKNIKFTCGCCTIQGRAFVFDEDGHMFRYGSADAPVYGDWYGMYDFLTWVSGQTYHAGERVFDNYDGLVYQCIADVTTTAANFHTARVLEPDSWQPYEGEGIDFAWELPWADFGSRQSSKALRFTHVDAVGKAPFTLDLFNDNIYRDSASGLLIPARSLQFVPNDVAAFGAGTQTYGGGRRTREQKLWQIPVHFKLLKSRISGSSTKPLALTALSFLYQRGTAVRG